MSISAGQERGHFTPFGQIKTELQSWLVSVSLSKYPSCRGLGYGGVTSADGSQTPARHLRLCSCGRGWVAFPAGFEVAQVQATPQGQRVAQLRGCLSWPLGIIISQIGPSSARPGYLEYQIPESTIHNPESQWNAIKKKRCATCTSFRSSSSEQTFVIKCSLVLQAPAEQQSSKGPSKTPHPAASASWLPHPAFHVWPLRLRMNCSFNVLPAL